MCAKSLRPHHSLTPTYCTPITQTPGHDAYIYSDGQMRTSIYRFVQLLDHSRSMGHRRNPRAGLQHFQSHTGRRFSCCSQHTIIARHQFFDFIIFFLSFLLKLLFPFHVFYTNTYLALSNSIERQRPRFGSRLMCFLLIQLCVTTICAFTNKQDFEDYRWPSIYVVRSCVVSSAHITQLSLLTTNRAATSGCPRSLGFPVHPAAEEACGLCIHLNCTSLQLKTLQQ